MTFYTYIYRDPARNEPIYVGKGKGRRAKVHLTRTDRHPLTHRIQKMAREGTKPIIEIIPAINESHALFMEECCIQVLGRKDLGKGPLLNLTDGGDGVCGTKWSLERRKALSLSMTGKKRSEETRAKLREVASAPRTEKQLAHLKNLHSQATGATRSSEARLKTSQTSLGHRKSEETKQRMRDAWVLRKAAKGEKA